MLYVILSLCKFSLPVHIRNGREISKIMFSHFSLLESPPNAKLPIFKYNKRQIPLRAVIPFANSVKIKLENLPLNSPKLIW